MQMKIHGYYPFTNLPIRDRHICKPLVSLFVGSHEFGNKILEILPQGLYFELQLLPF